MEFNRRQGSKMSLFEKEVFDYLLFKTNFYQEHSPNDLINDNGNRLYFDFFLEHEKIAIEVNGLHHYEPINGVDKFKRQVINDNCKRDWCIANGYKYIEINTRLGLKELKHTLSRIRFVPKNMRKGINQFIEPKQKKKSFKKPFKNVVKKDLTIEERISMAEERGRMLRQKKIDEKRNRKY